MSRRVAFSALVFAFFGAASLSTRAAVQSGVVGQWQGILQPSGGETPVELQIKEDTNEHLSAQFHFRGPGSSIVEAEQVSFDGLRFSAASPQRSIAFEGELVQDASALEGKFKIGNRTHEVILRMHNPAFRKFDHPRVDTSGQPLHVYAYQEPPELSDGWAVSTVEAEGLDPGQLADFMNRILNGKWGRAEGVVIARNGKLVVDEYFHGFHRDKRHTLQSVTKSITSLLFGVAMDQGSIKSVDQVVYEFFPEYAGRTWVGQKYDRTLHHLLTMSAAIDWDEHVPYGQIENSNTAMNRSPDWIGYVLDRDMAGPPGKVCVYTSGFTILLGGVIKKATGKYVDELADETLFGTLGITNYHWVRHEDGTRHTGGGLSLLPRDLAKVGQLVLNGGTWNGERVISEAWIKESTRPHVPMEAYRLKHFKYTKNYTYQWWNDTYEVDGRTIDVIGGHGFGGQYLGIVPELHLVIVLTGGDYVDQTIRPFEYYKIMEQEVLPAVRLSP